jgi:hypothetical protein
MPKVPSRPVPAVPPLAVVPEQRTMTIQRMREILCERIGLATCAFDRQRYSVLLDCLNCGRAVPAYRADCRSQLKTWESCLYALLVPAVDSLNLGQPSPTFALIEKTLAGKARIVGEVGIGFRLECE